jgi:hypothetical protein
MHLQAVCTLLLKGVYGRSAAIIYTITNLGFTTPILVTHSAGTNAQQRKNDELMNVSQHCSKPLVTGWLVKFCGLRF